MAAETIASLKHSMQGWLSPIRILKNNCSGSTSLLYLEPNSSCFEGQVLHTAVFNTYSISYNKECTFFIASGGFYRHMLPH